MSRASRYASNRQKRIAQSSSPRRTCPSSSLICLYVPSARPRTHAHPPCSPATRNCQPDRVCRTSRCKAASSFRLPSLCPRDSTTLDLGDQRVRDEAVVVLDLGARISAGHLRPPAHRRSPLGSSADSNASLASSGSSIQAPQARAVARPVSTITTASRARPAWSGVAASRKDADPPPGARAMPSIRFMSRSPVRSPESSLARPRRGARHSQRRAAQRPHRGHAVILHFDVAQPLGTVLGPDQRHRLSGSAEVD